MAGEVDSVSEGSDIEVDEDLDYLIYKEYGEEFEGRPIRVFHESDLFDIATHLDDNGESSTRRKCWLLPARVR